MEDSFNLKYIFILETLNSNIDSNKNINLYIIKPYVLVL